MTDDANLPTGGPLVRGYFVPVVDPRGERPVTVAELLGALRRGWLTILLLTFAGTALGVALAYTGSKRYESRAVLMPVADSSAGAGLGGLLSQFGGIASLAGMSLGGDNLKTEAYAMLLSREFADEFIRDESLLTVLFEKRWDPQAQQWRPSLWRREPTAADAFDRFNRKIRRVEQDRRTGIVTLTIRWKDPDVAARWANQLVERVNARMRERAVQDARHNLQHLQAQYDRTQVLSLRETVARVMENEVRREMLATVRKDYAFRVIDPAIPAAPHEFVSPRRVRLMAGAFAFSFGLGLLLVLVRHFANRERARDR
jgi:uncharacterized protein involved in exopolysaccharide biosynthesis